MSSTNLFDTVIAVLYRYLGIPLYITANLGLVLTACIFSRRPWRKNVCVLYFLATLLVDFVNIHNTLLGNIVIHGFDIQLQNKSTILCKVFNYVSLLFETLSSTLLVLASVDRLLISSQNVETRLYSSRRLAYFSLSISIFFWSVFFLHVPIKFDIYYFGPFVSACLFDLTGFYADFFSQSILIINLILFVTMVILSVWSFRNVRRIRLIPRQQRPTTRTMHKKDFQLLRCLFLHDIVHIVCHVSIATHTVYKAVLKSRGMTAIEQARSDFLFDLAFFVHLIPYCARFFVYPCVSRAFRQDVKRLAWKACGKNLVIEDNDHRAVNVVSS